jgi:hypothetical protein
MPRWLLSVFTGVALVAGCDSAHPPGVLPVQTFTNEKANLTVTYAAGPPIHIEVKSGDSVVFTRSLSGDYRNPSVKFLELNGDAVIDIIVELADESGFEPMILLSRPDGTHARAAANLDASVEYANLDTGADSEPAEPYRVADVDADGTNELVFNHLYLHGTLNRNVVLVLNADGSEFEISHGAPPLPETREK